MHYLEYEIGASCPLLSNFFFYSKTTHDLSVLKAVVP